MSPSLDNTNHKFVHICCLKIELGRNNGIIATKCNPGECYIYRIGEYLATDFLGSLNITFVPFLHQCSLIFCILLEILLTCDVIKSFKKWKHPIYFAIWCGFAPIFTLRWTKFINSLLSQVMNFFKCSSQDHQRETS